MPNWTTQQLNAINARNRNILVSAAAGSGKTAVLVERVIKMISNKENPVDVNQLLVVTFTNPAAKEMKSRISAALEKIIKNDPDNSNAFRQMSLLSSANILTIDSFCLNLVKEHFFELDIDQDFEILDESESNIIALNALNNVVDKYFENDDKTFIDLVQMFASPKNDKDFYSTILKIYNYIYAQPFPIDWLNKVTDYYNPDIDLESSVWYEIISNEFKYALNYCVKLINNSKSLLSLDDELFDKYSDMLDSDLGVIEALIKAVDKGWSDVISAFKNISFSRMPSKRGYESPSKQDIKSIRDIYKNIVTKDLKKFLCCDKYDYKEDMEILFPILKKLCKIIKEFEKEYFVLKKERNGYTFSDIEHFAINLLVEKDKNNNIVDSNLAKELRTNFHEILIDEYQDTNEAQDMLFSILSNGNNRFMVGDVKQSIYKFRLAMPFIFTKKKNEYSIYDEKNEGIDSKIILDKNFRSKESICEYVNYIFSSFMTEKVGELDYTEEEFLNYGSDYTNNEVPSAQIKILENQVSEDRDLNEAIYIAKTIKKKVESKELIKNKHPLSKEDEYRPINYGDFVVLFRSGKNHIKQYNEVFTEFGIPVICDNSTNLFENNEIILITSLLKIINNPMQDIPLLTGMMSPMYGFTADELTEIKIEQENKKTSLYTSVVNSKSEKVKKFIEEIDYFSKIAVTMSMANFIRYLCDFKSIFALVSAFGNGEQRIQNIEKFIGIAKNFDSLDTVGLTSFIRYINNIENSDRSLTSASLNATAENAVTIMTIHHSKGLEFPVVILAGSANKYNKMDLSQKMILNPFYGIGVKVHNEEFLYQYDTIPYLALKNLNNYALISENLRVLYVAMTRAKEQFITFITDKNINTRLNSLGQKIINGTVDPFLCKNLNSDADILLLAALMHQNGKELRKNCDTDIKTKVATFPLDIEFIDSIEKLESDKKEAVDYDEEIVKTIEDKLNFKYNNSNLSNISAKRTASTLDESIKGFEFFASSKPAFLIEDGVTPGEKGTAMHTFMQFCDYNDSKNDLDKEINRLLSLGYLTQKQVDCLDKSALSIFFNSDFAKEIFLSDKIYREIKVSSFVDACDIDDTNSHEKILIQGISDCVYEKDGELVIVDYKTDKVKTENQLLKMYQNQIAFYVKSVEKTLQKKVKKAVLYSFHLGKPCFYKKI